MANTVIQIKRSETQNGFSNIVFGELAFTTNGHILFVGTTPNGQSIAVGGRRYPGTLTANQSIVVDSNSHISEIKAGALTLSDSGVANVSYVGVISSNNLTGANTSTLVASEAIKAYVDSVTGGANTSTSNAVFTAANNTLLFTRADGTTYEATIETDNLTDLTVSANATINVLTVSTTANVANIYANNIEVSNNLTVNGDLVLRGSSIQLGDGGDVISLGASVNSSIIPSDNVSYDLGSSTKLYRQVYANQMTVAVNPSSNYEVATKLYVDNQISGVSTTGNTTPLGDPTDGAFSNGAGSTAEGALTSLANTTTVTEAIDLLNEVMYNVYQNTFVRDVSFTVQSGNVGGAPLTSTLSITPTGNADRYDINWGDGSYTNNTTDSTPSHTYTDNTNSPFDVTVTARNTNALGAGNTASSSETDIITLYTGDPNADFDLYNVSSGGTEITEANTNETIYLDNETTNANDVVATFFVNWGDGSNDSISNTSVAGGTQGARISHTYTSGTGTGSNTILLAINTHSTANPASLPDTASKTIKIFDLAISAPDNLSAKTLSLTSSSVGTGARLASGFINNTSEGSFSAGDTVTRYTTTGSIQTTGTANSTVVYNADSGSLSAIVDGSVDGTINFTAGDDTGSNASLTVVDELDFYNFNGSGSSVSTANRIHAPGLYSGFRARVNKSSLSTGTHTYKLSHTLGNTGVVEFAKDNLTGTPVINFSGTSVSQNSAGTLAYVSGVPYYTNDAVLDVSGVLVSNVSGQFYRNTSTPFNISSGTNVESDSGSAFSSQNKGYTLLPSSSLASGYPIANTGLSANVTLEDFTVSVNGGGRVVEGFQMRMINVNGNGSYVNYGNTNIAVYNGTSSGVDESNIPVSDSLGAGYDTDGKRLSNFSSTNATPTFANNVDYYVNNSWSGAVTVAGTDEAIVRYGDLEHNVQDYSSGYLPAGPDLATGRTGTQYFRFAFKRTTMANFTIRMTGNCASFHIAAPGTSIDDTSDSNGWLDASGTYAGAGTPGANTTAGGNGSDGCAFTAGDRITVNTNHSNETFTLTLGDQNASSSTNNQILVSVGLASGQKITALSVE